MADGYRFPQQTAGSYYYPQQTQAHHPRHQVVRNSTPPPNNIRSPFNPDTPSPSRSPDSHSPAPGLYGMYNQGHQGRHGRVNGRQLPMMYNYQQHSSHQQQHNQHHPSIQQDHATHTTNGIGHHNSFSSGILSNTTPSFTPNSLQNGHAQPSRGGQAQQMNEDWPDHWTKQVQLYKEAKIANAAMEGGQPNHFARQKASENKGIQPAQPVPEPDAPDEENAKDPARMSEQGMVKRQDWSNLDLSGQGLRVLAKALFNYDFLQDLYISSNKLTVLPAEFHQLRYLRHLDASNNQLTELPRELGMCVFLEKLLVFDNKITTLPSELGSLHRLEVLGIEGNAGFDEGMKNEIKENGTPSLIHAIREAAQVPLPPTPRAIIDLHEGNTSSQEKFKVFNFNILSNSTCNRATYGYSPEKALSWDYRKEQILQEIEAQDADVVCLQEIEKEAFEEYFSVKLAYMHYKGNFWTRTRARTMAEKDKKFVDGCATFYKHKKFILLDKSSVEYSNVAINRADMKGQADVFNRVMPRDHIGTLTFLENRVTGSRVLICNTHIFWNPAYADVKLVQVAILMESVNKHAEKYAKWPACTDKKSYALAEENDVEPTEPIPEPAPSKTYTKEHLPIVMCSDINSTSDSGVYELLSKGSIKPDHRDLQGFQYGNFTKIGIEHPFQIRSAYTNLDKTAEALPFTNYTPAFRGVIDHIWYSTNALENTSLLGPVDPEYMKQVPGFPNYHFPSDHLSLMAEFQFKGKKEKRAQVEPDFGPSSRRDRRHD